MLQQDVEGFTEIVQAQLAKRDPNFDVRGLIVTFEQYPVLNEEKTAKEGRPIFDTLDFVKIIKPGDRDNVVHREVLPIDKARFKDLWKAYQADKTEGGRPEQAGTPLKAWPLMTVSQVEELKFFHVYTVEQLAALDDEVGQKFPGINRLKEMANDFLKSSKDGAHVTEMRHMLSNKQNEIDTLKNMVKEMGDRLEKLESRNRK